MPLYVFIHFSKYIDLIRPLSRSIHHHIDLHETNSIIPFQILSHFSINQYKHPRLLVCTFPSHLCFHFSSILHDTIHLTILFLQNLLSSHSRIVLHWILFLFHLWFNSYKIYLCLVILHIFYLLNHLRICQIYIILFLFQIFFHLNQRECLSFE